jgi:hypothetical protein
VIGTSSGEQVVASNVDNGIGWTFFDGVLPQTGTWLIVISEVHQQQMTFELDVTLFDDACNSACTGVPGLQCNASSGATQPDHVCNCGDSGNALGMVEVCQSGWTCAGSTFCSPSDPAGVTAADLNPAEAGNAALIQTFYNAFNRRDATSMVDCYDPNIAFTDPIFLTMYGKRVAAMWSMLTGQAPDLMVQSSVIWAGRDHGHAHWDAQYTYVFLGLDNPVSNHVEATFDLSNGLITTHHDNYDLDAWMNQALAPLGTDVGQSVLQASAQSQLDTYISMNPQFQ